MKNTTKVTNQRLTIWLSPKERCGIQELIGYRNKVFVMRIRNQLSFSRCLLMADLLSVSTLTRTSTIDPRKFVSFLFFKNLEFKIVPALQKIFTSSSQFTWIALTAK
jgi:hypothetical protein